MISQHISLLTLFNFVQVTKMVFKFVIVLLFLVSHICANSEVLPGNGTSTNDFEDEGNTTDTFQTQNPLVPSLIENTTTPQFTVLDDSENVLFNSSVQQSGPSVKPMNQVIIGETKCGSIEVCQSINGSQCKEGVCECLETHVPDLNSTECLKIASAIENLCELDTQCKSFNTKCVDRKCLIEEGVKKSPTSGILAQSIPDSATSGARIYLSLLVLNILFLMYN